MLNISLGTFIVDLLPMLTPHSSFQLVCMLICNINMAGYNSYRKLREQTQEQTTPILFSQDLSSKSTLYYSELSFQRVQYSGVLGWQVSPAFPPF